MKFEVFIWMMFFAHFIGDYVLQSRWLAVTKDKEWYNMLVHCILYTGSVGLVLMHWINGFPYFGMISLFVSHWIIDIWKCKALVGDILILNAPKPAERACKIYLYIDQLGHFIVLAMLIIIYR